jgi:hypothetical protein
MATYNEILQLINTNLASGGKIPASKHREVEIALLDYISQSTSQQGDIKRIKCDITYLQANFEINGLGKNLRAGWAICNGSNGTDNLAGRVGVGYGTGYSTLSGTGGSKDAVVVEHSHTTTLSQRAGGNAVSTSIAAYSNSDQTNNVQNVSGTSNVVGVSGTDKNMQPYIIQLYIMKL